MIASGAGLQVNGDNVELGRWSNTQSAVGVRIGNTFPKVHLINPKKNLTLVPANQAPKIYYNEILRSFLKYFFCILLIKIGF